MTMKKYLVWLLWKLLHGPSQTVTLRYALFLPWLSTLLLINGVPVLVVEQPDVFTVRVIPYSFKKLLFARHPFIKILKYLKKLNT